MLRSLLNHFCIVHQKFTVELSCQDTTVFTYQPFYFTTFASSQ